MNQTTQPPTDQLNKEFSKNEINEICRLYDEKETKYSIAKQFGVHEDVITKVINENWTSQGDRKKSLTEKAELI